MLDRMSGESAKFSLTDKDLDVLQESGAYIEARNEIVS
jgi:hypothetical protein